MADIVFKYSEMTAAADQITEIAGKYKSAAETLETEFISAISGWEGDSHDKMQNFMSGAVKSYTAETIPDLLNSLAELLRENVAQMQKADQQVAESIPTALN